MNNVGIIWQYGDYPDTNTQLQTNQSIEQDKNKKDDGLINE